MVALIDTNVIIDFLTKREPYAEDAIKIISLCNRQKIAGYLAAHTIPDLFYILRRDFSIRQRKEMLKALCKIFNISGLERDKILAALDNDEFEDFEDCLQMECAVEIGAEYIITRNLPDFVNSKIPAIEPKDILKTLSVEDEPQ